MAWDWKALTRQLGYGILDPLCALIDSVIYDHKVGDAVWYLGEVVSGLIFTAVKVCLLCRHGSHPRKAIFVYQICLKRKG